ncbi:MAG: hypothetical protein AAFV85_12595 [Cyanobacteria bacterium J06634_6]
MTFEDYREKVLADSPEGKSKIVVMLDSDLCEAYFQENNDSISKRNRDMCEALLEWAVQHDYIEFDEDYDDDNED